MKKFLSLLLALCMMMSAVLLLSACDKKEDDGDGDKPREPITVEAPAGYTAWKNEDIGFAYPSSWTKADYPGTLFMAQSALGNNINVLSEPKQTIYSTVTNENFMEVIGPSYEMVGASISNPNVSRVDSANGVEVIKFTFQNTMTVSGTRVTVHQAQYYVNVGAKTYAITATGRSNSELLEILSTLESTLVVAK